MKKFLFPILLISIISLFSISASAKKDVVEKQWLADVNTYMIICKGWPKEDLEGKQRIESAKDAALINAQMIAKEKLTSPVDPIRHGTVKKYEVYDDYVAVYYAVKYRNIKRYIRK